MSSEGTAVVWISDGSGVPFSDLEIADASDPGMMGQLVSYKGTFETEVPIGNVDCDLDRNDDVFVPEAEWCIGFIGDPTPYLENPRQFTENTLVVLQGMIEGKWLNRLIGNGGWKPASLGNNLLAAGSGITTAVSTPRENGVRRASEIEAPKPGDSPASPVHQKLGRPSFPWPPVGSLNGHA